MISPGKYKIPCQAKCKIRQPQIRVGCIETVGMTHQPKRTPLPLSDIDEKRNENTDVHPMPLMGRGFQVQIVKAAVGQRTLRDSIQWRKGQGILSAFNASRNPIPNFQSQQKPAEPAIPPTPTKREESPPPRRPRVVTFDLSNTKFAQTINNDVLLEIKREIAERRWEVESEMPEEAITNPIPEKEIEKNVTKEEEDFDEEEDDDEGYFDGIPWDYANEENIEASPISKLVSDEIHQEHITNTIETDTVGDDIEKASHEDDLNQEPNSEEAMTVSETEASNTDVVGREIDREHDEEVNSENDEDDFVGNQALDLEETMNTEVVENEIDTETNQEQNSEETMNTSTTEVVENETDYDNEQVNNDNTETNQEQNSEETENMSTTDVVGHETESEHEQANKEEELATVEECLQTGDFSYNDGYETANLSSLDSSTVCQSEAIIEQNESQEITTDFENSNKESEEVPEDQTENDSAGLNNDQDLEREGKISDTINSLHFQEIPSQKTTPRELYERFEAERNEINQEQD